MSEDAVKLGNPRIGDKLVFDTREYAVVATIIGKDRNGEVAGVVLVAPWGEIMGPIHAVALPAVVLNPDLGAWEARRPSGIILAGGPVT